MKERLRIRRLTLALAPSRCRDPVEIDKGLEEEADRIMFQERSARDLEMAVAVSSRPGPHIHGVEDWKGSRFWARQELEDSSDEEVDEEIEIDTPDMIRCAGAVGFSVLDMMQAEEEIHTPKYSHLGEKSLAKRIVDAMVDKKCSDKNKALPWQGPIPPPRSSPPMTFGAALDKANVSPVHLVRSGSCRRVRACDSSNMHSNPPEGQCPFSVTTSSSTARSSTVTMRDPISKFRARYEDNSNDGRSGALMAQQSTISPPIMFLSSHIPYRPTQGLAALFANAGTRIANPRAPYFTPSHSSMHTYAAAAKFAMENNSANNFQRGGSANHNMGRGNGGQAGMIGRGFNQQPFHPGYGGGYPFGGRGGGHHNPRGNGRGGHHLGGRQPFRGIGGRGYGGGRGIPVGNDQQVPV